MSAGLGGAMPARGAGAAGLEPGTGAIAGAQPRRRIIKANAETRANMERRSNSAAIILALARDMALI